MHERSSGRPESIMEDLLSANAIKHRQRLGRKKQVFDLSISAEFT
jgi:hypothetical protein